MGVCIHNGIVHNNRDEWTVDDCTECTCQVSSSEVKHTSGGDVTRLRRYTNTHSANS